MLLVLPWAGSSQLKQLTTAEKLKDLMSEGRGLREALALLTPATEISTAAGEMAWLAIVGPALGSALWSWPLSILRVGFSIAVTPSRQPGNRRAHTPRDIGGLDPVGLEGLSANLLAHAPRECRGGDAEGGPCSLQYWRPNQPWQALVDETAALPVTGNTGSELVPYSLRKG